MRTRNLFQPFARTLEDHFKVYSYAAILRVLSRVYQAFGAPEAALEAFPFLAGYNNELASFGLEGLTNDEAAAEWVQALQTYEQLPGDALPLVALREAAQLDEGAMILLFMVGLLEEDSRFGPLYEILQGLPGQHRPTLGLLSAMGQGVDGARDARAALRRLQDLCLIQAVNPEAPRLEWAFQPTPILWDAIRGERHTAPAFCRYHAPEQLLGLDDLILPEETRLALRRIPALLARGEIQTFVVRGPQQNSRRTTLGAVARQLGRGLLEMSGWIKPDDENWRLAGPLATLYHALPVLVFDLAPGETGVLPHLEGYAGPLGVVLGKQGGLVGEGVARALTLDLAMPSIPAVFGEVCRVGEYPGEVGWGD
jgi:hypothetical protein